jgi:hypothetical protein
MKTCLLPLLPLLAPAADLQTAIDVVAARGGGVVVVTAGRHVTGTLTLKSNVTLRLDAGATLIGSRRIEDYNPRHLIYARDAENIAIEGSGTIDGQGDAFWEPNFKPKAARPSPLLEFVGCRNVRVQDVRIVNAPGWTIHPKNCDGVVIRGISIVNHLRGPNTDGIDPDSSRNVRISDSYIETGDDSIVLKTTRRGEGPVPPCENVTVTNCVLVSDDAALKLGTESHADIRHVVVSNCVIRDSRVGIAFFAKDGGRFENISFSNITIQTLPQHPKDVEWPIFLDLEKRFADSALSRIRDISFSDIQIVSRGRVLVGGMPEQPIEGLTFRNILHRVTGFETVEGVSKPRGSGNIRPAGREINYGGVPAAWIFANVRGLDLRDVRVIWDTPEPPQPRAPLYLDRVTDARTEGFSGEPPVRPSRRVLAFYYNWYGTPQFQNGRWEHWKEGMTNHPPELYDSTDPAVIRRHLTEAGQAGLDGLITTWWGRGHFSDRALARILDEAEAARSPVKFTIYYERVPANGDVAGDFRYLFDQYARRPAFLTEDGKPVFFIYGRALNQLKPDQWRAAVEEIRKLGPSILMADGLDPKWLEIFDGLHEYNPVGQVLRHTDMGARYRSTAAHTRVRGKIGCATVIPGYDDSHIGRPRVQIADREKGALYERLWRDALAAGPDWVLITSFNEWHEGSEIEPSKEWGDQFLKLTGQFAGRFKR